MQLLFFHSISDSLFFPICLHHLRAQMKWCEASLGLSIGTGTILQQCGGNIHLILTRGNVERCVAILGGGVRGGSFV